MRDVLVLHVPKRKKKILASCFTRYCDWVEIRGNPSGAVKIRSSLARDARGAINC